MIDGLVTVLGFEYMLYVFIGVIVGIVVGALPGFTATMGTALVLPFTFVLSPAVGIGMLAALYVAAMYSDCVPAILVNTPGTPASLTTAFDGYPMTLKGEGQQALTAGAFASMIGAVVGGLMFLFLAPPLAAIALRFGPPEFFWIGVFAITIIGSIAGESLLRGAAGGVLGMLVSTIGLSTTGTISRFTFGIDRLRGGISLVAALIGIFALPQVLQLVAKRKTSAHVAEVTAEKGVARSTVTKILRRPGNLARSSLLGGFIGVIPGAGGPVSALVSYNESKRWAKDSREYGKGSVHGVVASEAANSAGAGGALVPLMALGVPGSPPAAVIMGALLLQGIQPGPSMFRNTPDLVFGFGWSVIFAGLLTFVVGSFLAKYLAKMVKVPVRILIPVILMLSMIGAYAIRTNRYDVYMMTALGLFVFLLTKIGFHPGPIGLGLILGPIVEPALVQSLALTRGSSWPNVFLYRPLSIGLIVLTLVSVLWVAYINRRDLKERLQLASEELDVGPGKAAVSGRTVNESVVAGAVCLVVGVVFYWRTGETVQEFILPWIVTGVLGLLGIVMIIRGLLGRDKQTVPLIPVIFQGYGVDVAVVSAMFVAAVIVFNVVGFWITAWAMMVAASIYLANERTRKAIITSTVTGIVLVMAMWYVMLNVFYVPFPKAFFLG